MKEKKIVYRQPTMDDIDKLCELEKNVWGEEMGADRKKWESRLNIFPDGIQIAEFDNRIIGAVATVIVDWNYVDGYLPTWAEMSGEGLITNHNPQGNVMLGIDLAVVTVKYGVANRLVQFTKDLQIKKNIFAGGLGCRIPSLAEYVAKNSINNITKELVEKVAKTDVHVYFWKKNGFKIVAARKDFFPPDIESLGWGLILSVKGSEVFWE